MAGAILARRACALGVFLLILLVLPRMAVARVIYVSPAGTSGGDGSEAAPISDPAVALEASEAGDTILFRQGSYRIARPLYLDRKGLTLTSLSGERVVLAGGSTRADDLPAAVMVAADDVTLTGLSIRGGFYGIKLEPAEGESIHNVKLHELRIGETGADCIKSTNCDNLSIDSCDIGPSGGRQQDNAEGIDVIGSRVIAIRNCVVHDVTTNGIYLKGGTRNGVIENCIIRNVGDGGILLGQDTDIEYMRGGAKNEAIDCLARNNLVVNTGVAGLGAYSGRNVRFEDNTLVNVAAKGQAGLWIVTNSRDVPTEGAHFVNNIVYMNSPRPLVFLKDPGDRPVFEKNVYYNGGGRPLFRREITSLQKFDEWDFAAWQKAIGGDAGSMIADPQLDESRGYRLRESSPAKGVGRHSTTRPAMLLNSGPGSAGLFHK